jgi:hypothetical protein
MLAIIKETKRLTTNERARDSAEYAVVRSASAPTETVPSKYHA